MLSFLIFVILFHSSLLVYGILSWMDWKKHIGDLVAAGILTVGLLYALNYGSWTALCFFYGLFLTRIALISGFQSWKNQQALSFVVPFNAFMVLACLLSLLTQVWWVFILAYPLYWGMTLIWGKKRMGKSLV
ncbi:MAG: hypothetical protein AAFR61_26380 [Bacteroidota bacterium]